MVSPIACSSSNRRISSVLEESDGGMNEPVWGPDLVINRTTFRRMVRVIAHEFSRGDLRFQKTAVFLIQEAAEAYLVQMFEGKRFCTNTNSSPDMSQERT